MCARVIWCVCVVCRVVQHCVVPADGTDGRPRGHGGSTERIWFPGVLGAPAAAVLAGGSGERRLCMVVYCGIRQQRRQGADKVAICRHAWVRVLERIIFAKNDTLPF